MNDNIFAKYKDILEKETLIQIEEHEKFLTIKCPELIHISLLEVLDSEFFVYDETEDGVEITDSSFEELLEVIEECDFYNFLTEASAQRKIVIRAGKRKIIFKCPPGYKRIKRTCRKRPSSELAKLKRRARRAARKSKGKRARAVKRRKISLRRRRSLPKPKHK